MEQSNSIQDNGIIKFFKYGCLVLGIILISLILAIWYAIVFPSTYVAPTSVPVEITNSTKSSSKFSSTWESQEEKRSDISGTLSVDGVCSISLNSLKLTSDVDYSVQPSPPQVVLLDYTYKNTGTEDLVIDSSDLIVTDRAGALLESYTVTRGIVQPVSVKAGEEGHAVISFGVKHASEDLTVQIKKSTKLNSSKLLKLRIQ